MWCIRGDFNDTRFLNERVGAPCLTFAMWEFSEFISKHGLMDIPLVGGSFTWSNNQDPRWNRFLVSPHWEEHFPDLILCQVSHPLLDHFSYCLIVEV
jgi:hypothetical protein